MLFSFRNKKSTRSQISLRHEMVSGFDSECKCIRGVGGV